MTAPKDMSAIRRIVEAAYSTPTMPMPRGGSQIGILDRLLDVMLKAGVSEDDIRAGIDLTAAGMQKVAARLGIAASEVPMLLGSLSTRLDDEQKHSESAYEGIYEDMLSNEQFSYEKDGMGDVTVRDARSGKEIYLQGSQATDLLGRLEQDPEDAQAILGSVQSLMEGDEDTDYVKEMTQDSGTFNFHWSSDGQQGSGTAKYRFTDRELLVSILSVRDQNGDRMTPDGKLSVTIERIAREFIESEGS